MNIVDRLAESMFAPSCGRCGCQMEDRLGWRRNKQFSSTDQLIAWDWLCPACVVDYDWWKSTPPPNPDTDSLSSTDDLKGSRNEVTRTERDSALHGVEGDALASSQSADLPRRND